MSLIVSHRIREREFGEKIPQNILPVLVRTARVALATPIAGAGLPPGTRLLKAYATSPEGPRRVVYLLSVADGDLFLLFYRDKNDAIGANITINNQAFRMQLKKHLIFLTEDIRLNHFELIDIG